MKALARLVLIAGFVVCGFISVSAQQLGDTLHVATTWVDQQHEASFGRMIGIDEPSENNWQEAWVTWTVRESQQGTSRADHRIIDLHDGIPQGEPHYEDGILFGPWSVAPTLAVCPTFGPAIAYVNNRDEIIPEEYHSSIATVNPFFELDIFHTYDYPEAIIGCDAPRISGMLYEDHYYLHSLLYSERPSARELFYHRGEVNPISLVVTNATPDSARLLVTAQATNFSGVIATSFDGSRVAIAQTVGRYNTLGEGAEDRLDNNDIYIWESEDGGDTWDLGLENALNLTNFIAPNPDALPDTTLANQDTMRVYGDLDMMYDYYDRLHVAFTVINYYHFEDSTTQSSRLYYWNNEDQYFIMLADGNFETGASTPHMEPVNCNPNLYYELDTDVIWCSWVQYGDPEDYDGMGDPIDASDDGYKASDIYVSASHNRVRWAYGVNITNTRNEGTLLAPYETESEREMSLSLPDDGDYLHFFYTVDYDPGISVPASDLYHTPIEPQGEPTENIMVYHWVEKQDILDQFDYWEYPPYVIGPDNYPLHIDSTGFFEVGVDEDSGLDLVIPGEFELKAIYPNPFNATARIEFSLPAPDYASVTIVDVLGREVARLADRRFTPGSHTLTFDGSDFASSVYFVRTRTQNHGVQVRKVVLMK